MDIQTAREQIKRCVRIYLEKDENGAYRIPVERQRPVFLLGAPGIGKTAIMEQIAQETGLPLVSYAMTHHTRQSALGLPMIVERDYQGERFSVSEYTLSEIISTLYQCMERTGKREGILFLDEINCVSETLAPSMLQFLQYKTFGNHRIPEGWVIVTAGNPPQYNRAVRAFDIVTLDRLKVMEIEPDYAAWQRYAREMDIHRAVQGFLDVRRDDFYRIESGASGRQYVTARGWEDLSDAIRSYEANGFPVDSDLIGQYIRHSRIADEFATYYALYSKYRDAYPLREMLDGGAPEMAIRARQAPLDERLTLLELLLEALLPDIRAVMNEERVLTRLRNILRDIRDSEGDTAARLSDALHTLDDENQRSIEAGTLSAQGRAIHAGVTGFLRTGARALTNAPAEGFAPLATAYADRVEAHQATQAAASRRLENLFDFVTHSWGTGNELLMLMTELTANPDSMDLIYVFGSAAYERHSNLLRLSERGEALSREVDAFLSNQEAR